MIIQIDHITISTVHFDIATDCFKKWGYDLRFIEKGVDNLGIKKKFLRTLNPVHDIAFLQLTDSYSVEIINHRSEQNIDSYIIPVIFRNPAEAWMEYQDSLKILNISGKPGILPCIDIPVFITTAPQAPENAIKAIIVKTNDLKKSLEFWGYLGFKLQETDGIAARMSFISPFRSTSLELIVMESPTEQPGYTLDSTGVSCIALISTSAKKDHDNLSENGITVTEIGILSLNGKTLNIFFILGPCNEIVEIIEITH